MQLFVPATALAMGRRGIETLFITTDFTRDRGENLFCFRHPLNQRADPSDNFQLSSHNYWKQLESDCSAKWVNLKWYSWNKSLRVNNILFFSSTLYGYKNHIIFIFTAVTASISRCLQKGEKILFPMLVSVFLLSSYIFLRPLCIITRIYS